ncbi:MAG: phosphatidylserine decarboxylase [Pseudomonadota bacterium]
MPYYGFASWDDFFTRRFRDGRRPVDSPTDDAVIANACESAPYRVATNIGLHEPFWIKAQPYSLYHMMAGDPLAQRFKGDPLGMFHFGGSTHVRFFRPEVDIAFDLHGQTPGLHSENIPVRARIATVKKRPAGSAAVSAGRRPALATAAFYGWPGQ